MLAAAALFAVTLTGCGDEGDGAAVLRVVAGDTESEYRFDVPPTVVAGVHRLELVNNGDEPHHAQIIRLDEGAAIDDLGAALASGDPAAVREVGTLLGGTGLVAGGRESGADAVIELDPGAYALICLVPDASGAPHVAHGMMQPFEVLASHAPSDPPSADVEVQLVDFSFEMPDTIDGDATLAVTNASQAEAHEMVILDVDDGVTVDDVVNAFHAGEPLPGVGVGGMQAIPPGTTQHLQLDLEPGRYLVLCAVPSPDGGAHLDAGMIEEVTVR